MNSRNRERVPTEISGEGRLVDTGGEFSFVGVDFTVQGMRLEMAGAKPAVGQKLELEFVVTSLDEEDETVALRGEIIRIDEVGGAAMCGVKWLEGESGQNIKALESYYMESFFNMID